ncbi:MAG: hypothetical protein JWP89_2003 [Schlesneria sp.]|nr:hypothetical protein [Schlesneria sp.]
MRPLILLFTLAFGGQTVVAQQSQIADANDAIELHRVKVLIQPKSSQPFEWKVGERVTLGVTVISDSRHRVIGLATDCLLVQAEVRENRIEAVVLATQAQRDQIIAAAKISEMWFVAMPYRAEHAQAIMKDVKYDTFLKENVEYRPADERDWGYGAANGKIAAPSQSEIRTFRETASKSLNDTE